MKRFWLGLLAVIAAWVPLLFYEAQTSPTGGQVAAVCAPILAREAETGKPETGPVAVICHALATAPPDDPVDTALLIVIVLTFTLVPISLLIRTDRDQWGALNVGLFWTAAGLALVFGRALAVRWEWTTQTASSAEPITDGGRAMLFVGGALLTVGVSDWMVSRSRRAPRQPDVALSALAASMPIVVADATGTIIYASESAAELAGWPVDELEGQNITAIMPESWRAQHLEGLNHYLTTRETHILGKVVRVELLRADGTEIPISLALTTAGLSGQQHFIGCMWEREAEALP